MCKQAGAETRQAKRGAKAVQVQSYRAQGDEAPASRGQRTGARHRQARVSKRARNVGETKIKEERHKWRQDAVTRLTNQGSSAFVGWLEEGASSGNNHSARRPGMDRGTSATLAKYDDVSNSEGGEQDKQVDTRRARENGRDQCPRAGRLAPGPNKGPSDRMTTYGGKPGSRKLEPQNMASPRGGEPLLKMVALSRKIQGDRTITRRTWSRKAQVSRNS